MTLEKKRNAFYLLVILVAFIISRRAYDSAGIVFQADALRGYWQFIDPELLRTDLWRSVFYLHSQPPLMNLFAGIIVQLFPQNYESAFHAIYYVTGILLAGGIYWMGIALRFPKWLAALTAALFAVSPAAVLYEHWLTYAYPLTAALTLSIGFLHQFLQTKKNAWGAAFFFMLALLSLTWSLFHLIWLLGVAAGLFFLWDERGKVARAALIPVLLVTGWYIKNLILVGDFTSSSWAGMNLAKIVTFRVSAAERERMVADGELSPFALIPPFRNPLVYLELLPDTPETGIPVLDRPETAYGRNHHHLVYAEASRNYLKDALRLISAKPAVYARSVAQALYIYFHSASDYEFLENNRALIRGWDQAWNRLFYGQWQSGETAGERLNQVGMARLAWWIVFGFATALIGGGKFAAERRARLDDPGVAVALFMLYNILFVTLIGAMMDIGENNRFRFTVDPLLLALFVFTLWRARAIFKPGAIKNQNG